eukprot:6182032-Pleurochrysis_carterae.AAC.4
MKQTLFAHLHDMRAERRAAMNMHQECAGHRAWLFEHDDKCGSIYTHLPCPKGSRETAASTSSRWKYRTAMQANLYPNALLRFSLVPPCVRTGANFGCSAFFASLVRNQELGTLGSVVYRQTDGGSDSDAVITHVLHWLLVHMGVVDKIVWIRLKSKHLHSLCDRTFSMLMEKLWGKRGTGPGCADPWDFAAIVGAAMQNFAGQTELAWNWGNFDWYEVDSNLPEHGYVLVRYRRNLLPPKDGEPEFLPAEYCDGKWVPKPEGLLFMLNGRFPDVSVPADVETWKPAKTTSAEGLGVDDRAAASAQLHDQKRNKPWKRTKVFSDIMNYSMLSFSADQQDQWRALNRFHDLYATCDTVPSLPISCAAPPIEAETTSTWSMEHGTPISWTAAWKKLSWRFKRPHTPQQHSGNASSVQEATATADLQQHGHAAVPRARVSDASVYKGVTGINNPKRSKRKAMRTQQRDERVDAVGLSRDSVSVGELVFVGVPDCFEGELAVGFGRVVASLTEDNEVMVQWLQRVGVRSDPSQRGYAWTGSPTFVALMEANSRRVQQNLQPLKDVLPCLAGLTTQSARRYSANKPLPHKNQHIRVTQESITFLVEFCKNRLPHLYKPASAMAHLSSGAAAGSSNMHNRRFAATSRPRRQCQAEFENVEENDENNGEEDEEDKNDADDGHSDGNDADNVGGSDEENFDGNDGDDENGGGGDDDKGDGDDGIDDDDGDDGDGGDGDGNGDDSDGDDSDGGDSDGDDSDGEDNDGEDNDGDDDSDGDNDDSSAAEDSNGEDDPDYCSDSDEREHAAVLRMLAEDAFSSEKATRGMLDSSDEEIPAAQADVVLRSSRARSARHI